MGVTGKMKCTKCGNEIKDDVKFCPNCGEKVKEEKKIKYCMKCGSELKPDSLFCSECGASIEDGQKKGTSVKSKKPVKKVLGVMGVLVVLVLIVGCFMINSDKAMYKAYIKFHDEYCDKYLNFKSKNEQDLVPDCAAKIIMSPYNEKLLAIYYIINFSYNEEGYAIGESIKDRITLYRYSWGKVKKVTTFSKKPIAQNGLTTFSAIDDELYLFVDYYGGVSKKGNFKGAYRLNDNNKFVAVKANKKGTGDDITYTLDSGMGSYWFRFLGCRSGNSYERDLFAVNDVRLTSLSDFADVVDELGKYKIKNQDDLQSAYGKNFKAFG